MKSLCLLLCFLCWSAVWPQITLEQEPDRFDRQQKGPVPALAFLSRERSVSRRNLLRNARFHWEDRRFRLIADDAENVIYKVDQIDSLRILALRVEFEPDEDETTTGDGRFDLSIPPEPIIDPPPHNRAYFEDQMAALAAYFRTVSDGALILLPEVSDSVFSLPRPMADYAFEAEDEVNRGLTELFRDAIQAADGAGIVFSDYDCYIIFHAGVGRDVALSFDPTPADIPSAFLNLNDLREYIGNQDPSYRGIAVENGGFFIQEGILLPETESQEGYEIGLLGTAALMFGFQLGLPALWDTRTGRSGIGRWGLMDQGSGNFSGLLPAHPSAWCKYLLGWETPVTVSIGEDLPVSAPDALDPVKLYRIPITPSEYFLIENRQYDFDGSGTAVGRDRLGETVTFLDNGSLEVGGPVGVVVEVDEYDFGLPGSGILIWHVDERVIRDQIGENTINADPERRGVDLEEADAAQDIGEIYDLFSGGAGSELGVLHDAWFAGNEVHTLVNGSETVGFGPATRPATRSNAGGNSHIVVTDFSTPDSVMTFSVTDDFMQPDFPVDFGTGAHPFPPQYGDLDGDGKQEIIAATEGGKIFAWRSDGSAFMEFMSQGIRLSVTGDTVTIPVALFVDAGESLTVPPVVGDTDRDGTDEIIAATESGVLVRWQAVDAGGNGLPDNTVENRLDVGERMTALMLFDTTAVVGTESGRILFDPYDAVAGWEESVGIGGITGLCRIRSDRFAAVTEDGSVVCLAKQGTVAFSHRIGTGAPLRDPAGAWDPSSSDPSSLVIIGPGYGVFLGDTGSEEARFGERVLPAAVSDPALGDLDGDGFIEVVVTAGGRIWAFNHNGPLVEYFPVPRYERSTVLSEPVIGDVDGDGKPDLLITTSEGLIEGYAIDGNPLDGFPLPAGSGSPVCPLIMDVDEDGDVELLALSDEGMLTARDLDGLFQPENNPWPGFRYDPSGSGRTLQNRPSPAAEAELMEQDLVYNYPNPTEGDFTTIRYRLERAARVTITIYDMGGERIAEFEGPGDGPMENEAIWNLDGVASGVYFCRVKAESGSEQKTVQIKIAVVK